MLSFSNAFFNTEVIPFLSIVLKALAETFNVTHSPDSGIKTFLSVSLDKTFS